MLIRLTRTHTKEVTFIDHKHIILVTDDLTKLDDNGSVIVVDFDTSEGKQLVVKECKADIAIMVTIASVIDRDGTHKGIAVVTSDIANDIYNELNGDQSFEG